MQTVHPVNGTAAPARRALIALAVAALVAAAFNVESYRLFQMTQVVIFAIALVGLNLLTGRSGQISLGHGAFFALGAYGCGILVERFGIPYYLALPLAGAGCFLFGLAVGYPAIRLDRMYLALTTFALAVAMPQVLKSKALERWTGGVGGLNLEKTPAPFGLPINPDQWVFLVSLSVLLLVFVAVGNLLASRTGSALLAIREHALAAETTGIDVAHYKAMTFGISGLLTGIAGGLSALSIQFVAPDSFTVMLSLSLLVGAVIGGLGSLYGVILGALFIQFVPNMADQLSKAMPAAVYGAAMLVVVFLLPDGVAGGFRSMVHRGRLLLQGRNAGDRGVPTPLPAATQAASPQHPNRR